jgi:hypothetical protein
MGAQNQERTPFCVSLQLGSPSADDAIIAGAYFYAHRKCVVTDVVIVNGATLAASDTNYTQVSLKNGSDVVAEIDTRAAHENGLVADVAKALNLVAAKAEVAAGSTLTVAYDETDAGTNVALTNAVLLLYGWWKESA